MAQLVAWTRLLFLFRSAFDTHCVAVWYSYRSEGLSPSLCIVWQQLAILPLVMVKFTDFPRLCQVLYGAGTHIHNEAVAALRIDL